MGFVTILGDLTGGDWYYSGLVWTNGKLAGIKVGGSVTAGIGDHSGWIESGADMGLVSILGDLTSSVSSGGKIARVKVSGSVTGGRIESVDDMGFATIVGSLIGGSIVSSGSVKSGGKLAGVKVGCSVTGGTGVGSGRILASGDAGASPSAATSSAAPRALPP